MSERIEKIDVCLRDKFEIADLRIKDQSHLHAGHAGARDGRGHFDVMIVSPQFAGLSRLERHKMVYDALGELMQTDIHAVRIKALSESAQSLP